MKRREWGNDVMKLTVVGNKLCIILREFKKKATLLKGWLSYWNMSHISKTYQNSRSLEISWKITPLTKLGELRLNFIFLSGIKWFEWHFFKAYSSRFNAIFWWDTFSLCPLSLIYLMHNFFSFRGCPCPFLGPLFLKIIKRISLKPS